MIEIQDITEKLRAEAGDPIAQLTCRLNKIARGESRWDETILSGEFGDMTKQEVFDYYSHPKVRNALLNQLRGRKAIVVQNFTPQYSVLKRHEEGKPIKISGHGRNVDNPEDLSYFAERRAVEFHPVWGKREKEAVVDVDPGATVPFERTKAVVQAVADRMKEVPGVKRVEVDFSGGTGFYVRGKMSGGKSTNRLRALLKDRMADLGPKVSVEQTKRPDWVRLDVSTLHPEGSVRARYSLNKETGLVSVPVKDLATFQRQDALPRRVLGNIPRVEPERK